MPFTSKPMTRSGGGGGRLFLALCVALVVLCNCLLMRLHCQSPSSATEDSSIPHPISMNEQVKVIEGDSISFRRLSTTRGLSQTRVSSILQDNRGFLWFGTQYGLDRYDGYEFQVFKHETGKTNCLSGVYIHALMKDHQGNIWVASDEYLDKLDPVTESFTSYRLDSTETGSSPGPFQSIAEGPGGMIWLASGSGLYRLDPVTHRSVRFTHSDGDLSTLSSSDVKFIGFDHQGKLWATTSLSVDQLDQSTARVTFRIPFPEREREAAFLEDSFGTFWILNASRKGGIAAYDRRSNHMIHYEFPDLSDTGQQLAGWCSILEDRDHKIWIGTGGEGLLEFDRQHNRFIRYISQPKNNESLPDDYVLSLFQDRDGTIWVGLHQTTPAFFVTQPPQFDKFIHGSGFRNTLGGILVSSIHQDSKGILWISSAGSLNRIDQASGQDRLIHGGNIANETHTMIDAPDGVIWIGTFGDGLKKLDEDTGRQISVKFTSEVGENVLNDPVVRVLFDREGNLWAATWGGLKKYNLRSHRVDVYKPDSGSRVEYYDITQDSDGYIWLAGSQGLHRFDPATGRFKVYHHLSDEHQSLSDIQVNAVHIEPDGSMWIATQDGFDHFDPRTGVFTPYYEKDGLAGNVVNCILGDGRGYLWMSTNNGISQFDPRTRSFRNYSVADGLPGPDLTGWGACTKTKREEMFFGGFSGATGFFPGRIIDSGLTPDVALTDFRISGESLEVGSGATLSKAISYTNDITLTYKQTIFSIEFAALSYLNAETIRYRYTLQGLDQGWHEVGSEQRIASYTTLPPGTYTFRVQAAASHGAWSNPGASVRIRILPPWWGAWWFRVICSAGIVLLVCLLYRNRLLQIEQRYSLRLQARVAERVRIARELHDTLLQSLYGLVLQFQTAAEITPNGTRAREMLEEALARSDQVLIEGREKVFGLRGSALESDNLAEALSQVGESLRKGHNSTFSVAVNGVPQVLHPIVREEMYRIGREAITNAFRHADARQIEVEISYEGRVLRIRIRDDGRGIDPSFLESGARSGHWGLPGMRERAQTIGAHFAISSSPAAGTKIELEVPASVAYQSIQQKTRQTWLHTWL
jgi:signal transduction histidine kinase/ligand-binding sensor domain-containing protein